MNKLRLLLLSSAAAVGVSGAAQAVEPIPYMSWTGPYIGGNIGLARMDSTCAQTQSSYGYYGPCTTYYGSASSEVTDTGLILGVQGGWDWQVDRSLVVGVVIDREWATLSHSAWGSDYGYYGQFTAQVNSLSSLRARAGLVAGDTMVYVTGGAGLGGLSANSNDDYGAILYSSLNQMKIGWVAGAGVEHRLTPHVSIFAEALYYDFGNLIGSSAVYSSEVYQSEFNFSVVTGRLGVNFRF